MKLKDSHVETALIDLISSGWTLSPAYLVRFHWTSRHHRSTHEQAGIPEMENSDACLVFINVYPLGPRCYTACAHYPFPGPVQFRPPPRRPPPPLLRLLKPPRPRVLLAPRA